MEKSGIERLTDATLEALQKMNKNFEDISRALLSLYNIADMQTKLIEGQQQRIAKLESLARPEALSRSEEKHCLWSEGIGWGCSCGLKFDAIWQWESHLDNDVI